MQHAHRVCVLGVWPQIPGQKSPALLAIFAKADKKGGDLLGVWSKLKEQPCSWGNAQRQYKAWRSEMGLLPPAQPTPAAKPAGGTAEEGSSDDDAAW